MKLAGRIAKLERTIGLPPCPVCGLAEGASPAARPLRVEYVEDGPLPPREDDTCPGCGRARFFVIRVVYDPEPAG